MFVVHIANHTSLLRNPSVRVNLTKVSPKDVLDHAAARIRKNPAIVAKSLLFSMFSRGMAC